jgi:hypothetical protein
LADFEEPSGDDDSLKSLLDAAFDEVTAAPEPVAEVAPESKAPARDEKGKFATAKAETASEEAPAADPAAEKPPAEATEKTDEGTDKTDAKPKVEEDPSLAQWKRADRELLAKQPPEVQQFMLRREQERNAEFTRKTQEVASLKREYEPVQALFAPHADLMAQRGWTPSTMIQAWYNVEKGLMEGRGVSLVKGIVENYKIDRAELARELGLVPPVDGQAAPPPPMGHVPPELQQKIAQFEQFQTQLLQERQFAQQREFDQRATQVMNEIEQFQTAKGPDGTALHPYFSDVEGDMTLIITGARARGQPIPTLQEAYDTAVWANPSTRARLIDGIRSAEQAQTAAQAEKARADARAKAEKATRAATSVRGAPSNGYASGRVGAPDSLRDTLAAAFEESEAA